jgi:hypothetical protein
VKTNLDGVHWAVDQHKAFGEELAGTIRQTIPLLL